MIKSDWSDRKYPNTLVLFDVDGTLSPSRKVASKEMISALAELRKKVVIGFVGGSDLPKQQEQLGDNAVDLFDYAFSENGVTAYKCGKQIGSEVISLHHSFTFYTEQSFLGFLGEEKCQQLINFLLHYIADLKIPKKRGTFIEFRKAMINVSPIGRNCSHEERKEFEEYDKVHGIRKKLVEDLKKAFPDFPLKYSIGGQISIDIFPLGWDKTYCLNHVKNENFKEIHFFGDMTHEGGNDFEIFHHPNVIGHTVKNPEDTLQQLSKMFP